MNNLDSTTKEKKRAKKEKKEQKKVVKQKVNKKVETEAERRRKAAAQKRIKKYHQGTIVAGYIPSAIPTGDLLESGPAEIALGKKYGVSMPISEEVNRVLFEGASAKDAVRRLMQRERKPED